MRVYTTFKVTAGVFDRVVAEFDTFLSAMDYIDEKYGAENVVDQLIQLEFSNPDEAIDGLFTSFELYDMLTATSSNSIYY